MSGNRLCIGKAMLAALLAIVSSDAAPLHNYVHFDLTWNPPIPNSKLEARLLDTATVVKVGDIVHFEVLTLSNSPSYERNGPNSWAVIPRLKAQTLHYEVSCGFRSIRTLPADPGEQQTAFANEDRLLGPRDERNFFIDKACAGVLLGTVRGAATVDEAAKFENVSLANAITVQRISGERPRSQYPLSWMNGEPNRQLVQIGATPPNGDVQFLDQSSVKRDGEIVTADTFLVLGSHADPRAWEPIAALRKAQYDCGSQTLTVLAQSMWNGFGDQRDQAAGPLSTRAAAESPITAANIRAACAVQSGSAVSFSTIEDAWSNTRAGQTFKTPSAASCAWTRFSDAVRSQYLTEWQQYATQRPTNPQAIVPRLPLLDPASLNGCSVSEPHIARFYIDAYGMQRGALAVLANAHVDERHLLAALTTVPWLERRQFVNSVVLFGADNRALRDDVVSQIASRLGVDTNDWTSRFQIEDYLVGAARLEGT